MAGANGHKPDCGCPLCRGKVRTAEREQAEAEQAQTRRDAAWFAVMGQGGPDAVLSLARQHGDPQRAYRLLEAGGFDVAAIASRHRAEAPQQRSSAGNPWAIDPEHSPEAMAALAAGGTAAYRLKVAELAEDRQRERQERQQQPAAMWRTRDGGLVTDGQAAVLGASYGGFAPVQRSVVHTSVPETGRRFDGHE